MRKKTISSHRQKEETSQIPAKANRVLNVILIGMLLIVLRIWYLTVIQHDDKLLLSRRPQQKQITEASKRATIRDRFNIPLAINKMQYHVAILYSQLKLIPTVTWSIDENGKRVKNFKRRKYITALSQLLAEKLSMDQERIEDLIHAKASFYNQIPFVIKEDVTELEYYSLKMLEKDWPGIHVQKMPKRHYPFGKVASDIVGYMGAINTQEYEAVIREIKALESILDSNDQSDLNSFPDGIDSIEQVKSRLIDLHELAYTVNDSIGKAGIEGRFEKVLRGFRGKKNYYSDARGNCLKELPGTSEALSGKRVILTISAELQAYAEELLIQNETIRQVRLCHLQGTKHTIFADKDPWIKGGAIVVMDPNNGEVLALASHPRFDPNDFVTSGNAQERQRKNSNRQKWLENESYIASIWDQQFPLERELFDKKMGGHVLEEKILTWHNYLNLILSTLSPLKAKEGKLWNGTINDSIAIQNNIEQLLTLHPEIDAHTFFELFYDSETNLHKQALDEYLKGITKTYDRLLFIDLMRLALLPEFFNSDLTEAMGNQKLAAYRDHAAAMTHLHAFVKKQAKDLFHVIDFKQWRKDNEQVFLKKIRLDEKTNHRYAKPYIDYIDAIEHEQFQEFWNSYRYELLSVFLKNDNTINKNEIGQLEPYLKHFQELYKDLHDSKEYQNAAWINSYQLVSNTLKDLSTHLAIQYLKTLRSFKELNRPLLGSYRHLKKNPDKTQDEKHLAAAFYPRYGYGYGRSQAYRQAATQGSLFKLVTAYEALAQRYLALESAGKDFSDLNPLKMIDFVFWKGKQLYLGYDANNHPIPRNYKGGRVPRSAMATIGTIDLLGALETSSNPYFAILAGDILKSPNDLANAARLFSYGHRTGIDLPGEIPGRIPDDLETNRTGLYALAIGQHTLVVTPLQTSVMLSSLANGGRVLQPKIIRMLVGREPRQNRALITDIPTHIQQVIFLPEAIQRMLLDGMCRVVARTHGESLKSLIKMYNNAPEAIRDYIDFKYQLLGKTSTSESIETIDLDGSFGTNLYTHVWFGGIVYEKDVVDPKKHRFIFQDASGKPELVVVVYLRYGGYGKEGGPIAAQIAKKWREINANRKRELQN